MIGADPYMLNAHRVTTNESVDFSGRKLKGVLKSCLGHRRMGHRQELFNLNLTPEYDEHLSNVVFELETTHRCVETINRAI